MKKPYNSKDSSKKDLVEKLIGFGETSTHKSYYPKLQQKIHELQEEKKKYKAIFENALNGIFQVEKNGDMIHANPAMAEICGYNNPEELISEIHEIGKQLFADEKQWTQLIEQLEKEKRVRNYESLFLKKTHETIWVSINMLAVLNNNGEIDYIEGFLQDITKRKKDKEEISRLKNYLDNVINSMPSALIGIDSEGKITNINKEAEKIFNTPSNRVTGRILAKVFPQLAEETQAVQRAIRYRDLQKHETVPWVNDDKTHYMDIAVYPLLASDIEGAVIRVDDVTERVLLEQIMIQNEKMITVGGLAAGMAHEINNPLGIILQSVQNTQRRLSPDFEKNNQIATECKIDLTKVLIYLERRNILKYLNGIQDAALRASSIVSNMLNFSRRSKSEKISIDINQLLEKTIELASNDYDLKKKYDFRHIKIIREYDHMLPEIFCKFTEIEQVFLNLLKNAVHAIAEKHEEDYIPQIKICTQENHGYASITIEDNGPGMTEEIRKRVFEPFYTTKALGEGTGLGLSVSYFIITHNHQGTISVSSTQGKGTAFTIQLPLIKKEEN